MQVARRRWSAVLIAGSARTPEGVCKRVWLSQSGRAAYGCRGPGGDAARVRASSLTIVSSR
jgi:hypothetical protein